MIGESVLRATHGSTCGDQGCQGGICGKRWICTDKHGFVHAGSCQALVQAMSPHQQDKPVTLAALNRALEAWTTQIQSLTVQVKL